MSFSGIILLREKNTVNYKYTERFYTLLIVNRTLRNKLT